MRINEYQKAVERTIPKGEHNLANFCMGLAGESGETIDMFKKSIFHGHPLDRDEVIKELGDVMWYVTAIASEIGIELNHIAISNVDKLMKRYPNGFSQADSINRTE